MARLQDLYRTEKTVMVGDDENSVPIVVRKISPVQMESARRHANAAQALLRRAKNDHDSQEFLEQYNRVVDMFNENREELIAVIVDEAMREQQPQISARLMWGEGSKWAEDDYLLSLNDAWTNSLEQQWIQSDGQDEEANKVRLEIERFVKEVETELALAEQDCRDEWALFGTLKLQNKVTEIMLDRRSLSLWHKAFIDARTYFSVRETGSTRELYFSSINEVSELDERIIKQLVETYDSMSVDPIEGKDLPLPQVSLQPQEQLVVADTDSFGQSTVKA